MEQQQESSLFDLNMDDTGQSSLLSISKWTNFIAVTGIIIGSVIIMLALSYGMQVIQVFSALLSLGGNQREAGMLIAKLLAGVLLAGAWLYFLLRTSGQLRRGLEAKSSAQLAEAFRSMRTYFVISFLLSLLSILSVFSDII